VVVGKVVLKAPQKVVKWHNHAFVVDWGCPLYLHKLERVYVVDWESGQQVIEKGGAQALMSPEELDLTVNTKVIRELTGGLGRDKMESLLPLIVGLVIGFLAGVLTGYLIMQGQVQAIYDELLEKTVVVDNPDTPTTPSPWVLVGGMVMGVLMLA